MLAIHMHFNTPICLILKTDAVISNNFKYYFVPISGFGDFHLQVIQSYNFLSTHFHNITSALSNSEWNREKEQDIHGY